MGQDVPRRRRCRPPHPVFPIGTRARSSRLAAREHALRRRRSRPGHARARVPHRSRPRPGARVAPPRAHRLLLPHARLGLRGRGRRAGDDGPGLAGHRRLRGPVVAAVVAVPHRQQRVHRHAPQPAAPGPADGDGPVHAGGRGQGDRAAARARLRPADGRRAGDRPPTATRPTVAAARESIRLAFVAALQHLPARQRSVLILCEVLRWQATEVAELLDTSVASVNSALQRARATLAASQGEQLDPTVDPEHQALLARYVDAFERYDIPTLVDAAARRRRSCRCRRSTCGWWGPTTSPAGFSARASCARTAGCCRSTSTAPPASATTTRSARTGGSRGPSR